MIPKIIHYCWLSGEPFPKLVEQCIDSWKTHLLDYEFMLWDTKRFDVNSNIYVKEAFESKKYAFASDYIRLYALYNYGGIYLDSDVEVFKSFDDLLNQPAFLGFETNDLIAGWLMASEKGNPLFKEFLEYYNNKHFIFPDGHFDMTPNGNLLASPCVRQGALLNNTYQKLRNVTIYPRTFFCPTHPQLDLPECYSKDTHAQHLFNGGWVDIHAKELVVKKREIEKNSGKLVSLIYYGVNVIKDEGLYVFFKKWNVRIKNRKLRKIKNEKK